MRSTTSVCLGLFLFLSACGDDDGGGSTRSITRLIGSEGGTVELAGGAKVEIPPDALSRDVKITITELNPDDLADLPANLEPAGKPFAFKPHGQVFLRPVKIEVPYEGSDLEVRPMKLPNETGDTADWTTVFPNEKDDAAKKVAMDSLGFSVIRTARPRRNTGVVTLPDGATVPEDAGSDAMLTDAMVLLDAGIDAAAGQDAGQDAAVAQDGGHDASVDAQVASDAGDTTGWQLAQALTPTDAFTAFDLHIAAGANGTFIAAWYDSSARDPLEVRTSRYVPGSGWSAPDVVDSWTESPSTFPRLAITLDATGTATVVYLRTSNTRLSLWASRQASGGAWSSPALLETEDNGIAEMPAVAVDGQGTVTAVWQQNDTIFFPNLLDSRRIVASRFAGSAWTPMADIDLSANGNGTGVPIRVVANAAGDVAVGWSTSNTVGQYATGNVLRAGNWQGAQILTSGVSGENSIVEDVAINQSGTVAVALHRMMTGVRSVYVTQNTVAAGWGTPLEVDQATTESYQASVALADNGTMTAVWTQTSQIWTAQHTGTAWSTPQLLGPGSADSPRVRVDASGNVIAAWVRNPGSSWEVVTARLPVDSTWTSITPIEATPTGSSSFAGDALAVSPSGEAAVVWIEGSDPNAEPWANIFLP